MDCAIKATQPVAVIGTGKLATDNPWEKVKMGRARLLLYLPFRRGNYCHLSCL